MRAVPWWTWVCLALFLAVGVLSAAVGAVLALRTFRAVRAVQANLLDAVERLARDADALAARAEQMGGRVEELERHFEDVRRSAAKLGVLQWALGDSLGAVTRLRRAVPRK
jgi:TolA-binding protein